MRVETTTRMPFLVMLAAILMISACGGSADSESEASDLAAPSSAAAEADDVAADDPETDAPQDSAAGTDDAVDDTPATADSDPADTAAESSSADAPAPIDPLSLEPGTAIFVVEGQEYRFALGDSIFDICEFNAEFGLGQAKLDLVDGPADGSPHLQVLHGADKTVVVMAFPPETGYIAGKGEETDPYFRNFGIIPPDVTALTSGEGVSSGVITVANVITGAEVPASVAVRCN